MSVKGQVHQTAALIMGAAALASVASRIAVVGRLYALAEIIDRADAPPVVLLCETLRGCEATARRFGDDRLAEVLAAGRRAATRAAAEAYQWAA